LEGVLRLPKKGLETALAPFAASKSPEAWQTEKSALDIFFAILYSIPTEFKSVSSGT
jgi:hypothetical protein